MKLSKQNITRTVGRKVLTVKKNSPHIFFAAGVVGFAGTVVLAAKATMKLEETLDDIQEDLENVKALADDPAPDSNYDERQYYKDLGYVYGKAGAKLGRLYGPSILVGVASVGALTGSHVQLTRRNSALTATVAAISKAYDDYRVRIQEELGEEREMEIYRGISDEEIKNKDGKKEVVKVTDPNAWSIYARIFDESNKNWQKDPEMNKIFIQCQQNYMNHLLHARGHVFLNEVYDALGMERSQAGQVVGWVMDGEGDNFVDFGLFEASSSRFINGEERSIVLDFNVDGVVYDKF